MSERMYSVEEVAELLGLHVRTVRGYIRDGRLKAVRIGKQYRIARADLEALTGRPAAAAAAGPGAVEVSSIVRIEGIGRADADRVGTLLQAGAGRDPADPLAIQVMREEEHDRMKIVIMGGPAATAAVLELLEAVLSGGNLGGRVRGG